MSDRIRRKDLKGPDEFVSTTQGALEYARENPTRVAAVVAGILATLVVALGVRAYREWSADQARAAFAAAQETLAGGALEDAAREFEAVHTAHGNAPQGELALVQAGNAWADSGRREEAVAAFRKLLAVTRNSDLRQIALYNLGVLEKQAGEASATERLRQAAATEGPLRGAAWLATVGTGTKALEEEIPDGIPGTAREFLESRREG